MTEQENRYSLGFFVDAPLTDAQWKQWCEKGFVGQPTSGWVPRAIAPAGRTDFPAGFVLGWRKLKTQPKPVALSDQEALEVLEKMGKPQLEEQQAIFHSKVESAILSLLIDTKHPLSKLDINRKLSSAYPVSEVSRALTRLARDSAIRSNRIYRKKQGYSTVYSVD